MLSVVIISWNSLARLKTCLACIEELLNRSDVELVWVDNGSNDGSWKWMEEHYHGSRRIHLDRNYGVAYARNRGVEASSGRYVLFLDDDTEASPKSILAMRDYLLSHPSAGICGVALRDAQGNLQDSFKEYPGLGVKICNVVSSLLGIRKDTKAPSHVTEVDYLIGACQMIRREVFERIGLLDENIFYGPEDADFCMRAREAGFGVMYLPNVSIIHHWRRATSRNLFSPLGRKHIAALVYFYRKHRRWF